MLEKARVLGRISNLKKKNILKKICDVRVSSRFSRILKKLGVHVRLNTRGVPGRTLVPCSKLIDLEIIVVWNLYVCTHKWERKNNLKKNTLAMKYCVFGCNRACASLDDVCAREEQPRKGELSVYKAIFLRNDEKERQE